MKLLDLAVQAVDGTKVPSTAARVRSYDASQLSELLDRVDKAIADLEVQNEGREVHGVASPARVVSWRSRTKGEKSSGPEKLACQKTLRQRVR